MPNVLFEVDLKTQIEIEDVCTREGKNYSTYFSDLHNEHMKKYRLYTIEDVKRAVEEIKDEPVKSVPKVKKSK